MIGQNEDSLQGFEGRLRNAISDLEGALLGIADEEIQLELKSKGYTALNETGFRPFKNAPKKAALNRTIEGNRNAISVNEAILHEGPSSEESLDFDVSVSSYFRLPRSGAYLLPENFLQLQQERSCIFQASQSFITDDLIGSDSEFLQPAGVNDGPVRQRCTTGASVRNLWSSTTIKKRPHHVPTPFEQSHLATSQPIGTNNKTFERFMRKKCSTQMDLISKCAGRSESVWVPTKPKCSPQERYQQYQKFWAKYPAPGQQPRKVLRWAVRNQMAQKEEPQKVSWWPEIRLS
ncbi:hypothetical protein BIW11_10360 [Tropilaelaps mercedesae]|uniref:Centriolar and ciliogenesis-associated protein HYLS1 C-terminal domain-containing protein n=1 Tax=Tropilaelaps mercedesae TaxID=418985 RepID=A0A1V9XG14_9ACAR|nr:hypothetical protein BIW11_10360 [Tropilaelaps mercedesae]